jgi:hypothetical protein
MRYRPQRNWGARILEYRYRDMRAVFLENELLRVGVLADKGTDVFEFSYESGVPLHAMWGHHIAFGRPFLGEGCRVRLPEGETGREER